MRNKFWEDLGLTGKRAIIVHHDDLGMLQAGNRAYAELGLPTGSVMMPGSWAAECRQGDLGVHLTLTSEWAFPRMRPLTGGASLRDGEGYFWRTLEQAWSQIDEDDAVNELTAQIAAFRAMGIEPTHIDTHMGAVLRPDIATAYVQLAVENRLPCLLIDNPEVRALPQGWADMLRQVIEGSPLPGFRIVDTYGVNPQTRGDWYVDTLSKLGPGVYHLIHHAAVPTSEGQVLPDWEKRAADFHALQRSDVRQVLGEFVGLTYQDVRDGIRQYL